MRLDFRTAWAKSSLFLLSIGLAHGATYYVSTTGSDSNPGTASAPFRNVSTGVAAATNPGDTVIVMNGTYYNEGVVAPNYVVTLYASGTAANPITIMAQNRGQVILDSGNTSTTTTCNGASSYFNLYNASFVVIQGFVIQNACDQGFVSNDSAHDVTIRWNEIRYIANREVTDQYGRDGIYLNNTEYNFVFDGNIFHDIGRTSGVSDLHFDHGIYSDSQDITVINNVFYNMTKGWSIQFSDGAANWLIANNTFAGADASGEDGQIMFWGSVSNVTLENNIFYEPVTSALTQYAATISGCTFNSNLIYGGGSIMDSSTTGISIGANQIGPNPAFVNPTSTPPNFQLQAGSPAIAAGVSLTAVADDITGAVRPRSPDLGAYQSGAAGPVISGVFTSAVTTNSAAINWSTNEPATSYVQYGPSGYTNSTTPQTSMVTQHSVSLANLAASTTYNFRAASQDANGNLGMSSGYTFTTAANPVVPTTFSVSASSLTENIVAGQTGTLTINAALLTGAAAPVSFSVSGAPAGTVSFSSSTCTLTCSTSLSITPSSAAAGTYSVVVAAAGPGTSASATIQLTVASPVNLSNGLVAQWLYNQTGGTTAIDLSGNGNTGTVYNGYWWTNGPGQALWFNGTDSYISVPESPSLEMTNQLTVSFWLDPWENSDLDPRVIAKLYDWDVKLNGRMRYPQFEFAGQYAMLNYPLPVKTWHNIAFTFSSGTVVGYVDGVAVPFLQNTFTKTESLPQWAYGLYIATNGGTNPLIGSLSDVRVYNRVLSPAEIAALYAAK